MSKDIQTRISNSWIRNGAVMGFAAVAVYYGSAVLPLPDRLSQFFALVFPGLLLCGHVALYHYFRRRQESALNQAAVIFGIAAPVLVSAMLCAQMSIVSYMDRFYRPLDEVTRLAQINIWRAVDSVQLGLDVAWDMFILPTVILFSIGIMKHPAFGRIFGGIGVVFGVVGLVLNIGTFPIPPINVGLPDIGPFVVTWYVILFALLIRAHRKTQQAAPVSVAMPPAS